MQGECFAAVRRVREINRGATAEGCPNITDAAARPTPRAQHTNTLTKQKHRPNAGPPRRGPKPRDDAAQLRRDAAST